MPAKFLLALLLAIVLPAQAQEAPDWFAESFLLLQEDIADAAKDGKRVMLYLWQEGCPYCKRLVSVTFRDPKIIENTRRGFVPLAINVFGDREVTWTDGRKMSEKQFAVMLNVRATPTLIFFDEGGRIVLRLEGYVSPEKFAPALDAAARRYPG